MITTLHNKVALVTGGGRGIGRGTALALAKYGAKVAVMARSMAEVEAVANEIRTLGGEALALSGDVANYADVQRIVTETTSTLGTIDILINNAGVIGEVHLVEKTDPQDWLVTQQINLLGAYYLIHETLGAMKAKGYGRIANITSGAAQLGIPRGSAYSVSKAALNSLTRVVAAETQGTGVCVVAISPGEVDTRMQTDLRSLPKGRFEDNLYHYFQNLKSENKLADPLFVGQHIAAVIMTDKSNEVISIYDPQTQEELSTILAQVKADHQEGLS